MRSSCASRATIAGLLALPSAAAHCPLCTFGAAAAAGGAAWIGVSQAAIGIFIGAFAVSMGLWVHRLLRKEYVCHQKAILTIVSFLLTVLPVLPLMPDVQGLYVHLTGEYGGLLNRTYLVNLYLVGTAVGGIITWLAPGLSSRITEARGKQVPYQGILLTLLLLVLSAMLLEVLL